MNTFFSSQLDFINKVTSSSKIFNNIYTVIPSFLFLASLFALLYKHFLGGTTYYTRWKTNIFRQAKFQWMYFNSTRIWFLLLALFRKTLDSTEKYIETQVPNSDQNLNVILTRITAVIIVTSLAVLPSLVIYFNYMYKTEMPNFLMWVMEDPWLRHEIGISGHCLERPLRLDGTKPKNCSYRSRRSTSFEVSPWENRENKAIICRNCRSVIERNVVNSPDDMIN